MILSATISLCYFHFVLALLNRFQGFDGYVDLLTPYNGTFGLEESWSNDGFTLQVYIVLLDPTLLTSDSYDLQVSETYDVIVYVIYFIGI